MNMKILAILGTAFFFPRPAAALPVRVARAARAASFSNPYLGLPREFPAPGSRPALPGDRRLPAPAPLPFVVRLPGHVPPRLPLPVIRLTKASSTSALRASASIINRRPRPAQPAPKEAPVLPDFDGRAPFEDFPFDLPPLSRRQRLPEDDLERELGLAWR